MNVAISRARDLDKVIFLTDEFEIKTNNDEFFKNMVVQYRLQDEKVKDRIIDYDNYVKWDWVRDLYEQYSGDV